MTKTTDESQKLWAELQNLPLNIWALKNQVLQMHVTHVKMPGDKLYLLPRSEAVFSSLSDCLPPKYSLERADKYLIVSRSRDLQQELQDSLDAERQAELDAQLAAFKKR